MTYCYTRQDVKTEKATAQIVGAAKVLGGKAAKMKANLGGLKTPAARTPAVKARKAKASKLKIIAISAAVAAMTAFIVMPKTQTATPAAPQLAAAPAVQLAGAAEPTLRTQTLPQKQAALQIPEALTYKGIDSAIRDVQIDNAHLGHALKMALISDKNPIKVFFIWLERFFSLPALLVGFSFLFTLLMLGFIRPAGEDLSNY